MTTTLMALSIVCARSALQLLRLLELALIGIISDTKKVTGSISAICSSFFVDTLAAAPQSAALLVATPNSDAAPLGDRLVDCLRQSLSRSGLTAAANLVEILEKLVELPQNVEEGLILLVAEGSDASLIEGGEMETRLMALLCKHNDNANWL